ncbi:SGNH/GDSL hydrolase family protein [Proteiniphilum sp.]|uniref:SGNH/GDSL hydrolase family protein n=1 Tax=Proteiniphilum sp. TaxID=1926877 RepID=UPI002B20DA5F|nr:SGNH/GDSL hydrolase family protein [Proteiniphilum sp.]MEA4916838.1 SGNH/GDSL hydrolase family protein [Proteiniphilum sp.]
MKKYCTIRYYTFLWVLFLGVSCSADTKESLPDPVAGFSYTIDTGNTLRVNFKNESEHATTYTWDFGDNKGISTATNPSYTYASGGTYNVTLTVKNRDGVSNKRKKEITVAQNTTIGKGSKVSILGDSYSTFKDFVNPNTNPYWYPDWNNINDVVKVEQTWWHQLLQEGEAILEINNSYSGSTICNTGYNGANSTASSFITRMKNLGSPDLIIIFGGTNDSWANVPLGNYKYNDWTEDDLKSFRPAFAYMLDYLTKQYPKAKIVNVINSDLKAEITNTQTSLCSHYKTTSVQLKNIDKIGGHPSIKGMTEIKKQLSNVIFH